MGGASGEGRMTDNSQLVAVLTNFVNQWGRYEQTTDRVPPQWDAEVQEAVQAKRDGDYTRSVMLYAAMTERWGILYTGLLSSLYKTVVVSGHLREAAILLGLAEEIYQRNPAKPPFEGMDMTSFFVDHYFELERATASAAALDAYLRPLSGNASYRMPRDYVTAATEYREMVARVQGS